MADLINFRDFGDRPTNSGRRVRKDRLFRCGQFEDIGASEIAHLIGMDFSVVADLRYKSEQVQYPSPWPDAYSSRIFAHGEDRLDAPHLRLLSQKNLDLEIVDQFYVQFYRMLPFDDLYRPLYAQVILAMSEAPGRTLIHCAAGKDRTGVLCALILETLGVDRQAIASDYLASANARGLIAMKPSLIANTQERYGNTLSEPIVDALIGVKPAYLEAAIAEIETRDGSIVGYLRASGVSDASQDALRDHLLVSP